MHRIGLACIADQPCEGHVPVIGWDTGDVLALDDGEQPVLRQRQESGM